MSFQKIHDYFHLRNHYILKALFLLDCLLPRKQNVSYRSFYKASEIKMELLVFLVEILNSFAFFVLSLNGSKIQFSSSKIPRTFLTLSPKICGEGSSPPLVLAIRPHGKSLNSIFEFVKLFLLKINSSTRN